MPARVAPLRSAGVIARYLLLGAGLGAVVGAAWVLLAPRVLVVHGDAGRFVEAYPQGFAEADLTLGALLLAAGVVVGVVALVRLRRTGFVAGWAQIAGVLVACAMCAAVARVLGWWLAGRAMTRVGDQVELPLSLQANGVLLLAAFAGLLVVVLGSAFAHDEAQIMSSQDVSATT